VLHCNFVGIVFFFCAFRVAVLAKDQFVERDLFVLVEDGASRHEHIHVCPRGPTWCWQSHRQACW